MTPKLTRYMNWFNRLTCCQERYSSLCHWCCINWNAWGVDVAGRPHLQWFESAKYSIESNAFSVSRVLLKCYALKFDFSFSRRYQVVGGKWFSEMSYRNNSLPLVSQFSLIRYLLENWPTLTNIAIKCPSALQSSRLIS